VKKTLPLLLVLAAFSAVGFTTADAATPSCPKAWAGGWQKLANKIHAPVYCPGWLPDPLTGQLGGKWNNIDSVSKDRSYLMGFVWQERGEEIHINLRGYPGITKIPTCRNIELVGGKKHVTAVPCFADPQGSKTVGGITFQRYTVNQDADQWHLLYAWRYKGSLYTLSEHIAPPLTLNMIVRNLDRMMSTLVLMKPS
jgi:hypothetical protein